MAYGETLRGGRTNKITFCEFSDDILRARNLRMIVDSLPFSTNSAQQNPSYQIIFPAIAPPEGHSQSEHFFLFTQPEISSFWCFLSSSSLCVYFSVISNESSGLNQNCLISRMIGVKSILKGFKFYKIYEVSLIIIFELFNCIGISSLKSFNEMSSHSFNFNMRCFSEQEWQNKSSCENVSVVNVPLESQMTFNKGEDVSIENGMYEIGQVLKLSGGCSSFSWIKSSDCLKIDDSVEIISRTDFQSCSSLNEVIFSSNCHLREIDGFQKCISLCRIEIPASVELIGDLGFFQCTSLTEIFFLSDSHLREIRGFQKCTSLCRIEVPSSVEVIDDSGFAGCTSLKDIVFSSNSHLREISGFHKCTSLCRVEIPSIVEVINMFGFSQCTSLKEIFFSPDSHLIKISGFRECTSLCRIGIPSSVEVIDINGFHRCTSLKELFFSSDSHLREFGGFQECTSLCRIEIPSSVEVIDGCGFFQCGSRCVVVIGAGCRLRQSAGIRNISPFIVYGDLNDVKGRRRLVHLSIGRRRMKIPR
jgi:hypothetical protein